MGKEDTLTSISGALVGALVPGFGLHYLVKEKKDKESQKICGIMSAAGGYGGTDDCEGVKKRPQERDSCGLFMVSGFTPSLPWRNAR